ncbi:MAG TPA: hypothetical protein VF077_12400 [Nitrospiraceae bacterium]
MKDSTCPICVILAAAHGQQMAVALHLFKAACAVRCGCTGTQHPALLVHPHAQKGCVGYAPVDQEAAHG